MPRGRIRWLCTGRGCATPRRPDGGAAVVEFLLISVLLIFLLFAVLQVAVYFYVRNVVAASAADGARYGADAGVSPAAGGTRASRLIARSLNGDVAADVPCTGGTDVDAASGLAVATVHCHGRLRALFLPIHLPLNIDVTSSVLKEAGR